MKKLSLTLLSLCFCVLAFAQPNASMELDLEQCVQIAIENNLTIKRSKLLAQQSKVNLSQSKASQLPNLNLNSNYGYNWGRSVDPTSNQFINQQIMFSGVGGSANVTVFNWFRIANTIKQNDLLYESSEYNVQKAENDITLNIVTYYLNVILNNELVENAEYQLQSSQGQLERTKKLVAGGALPRTNELELVSQVATNEVNLVNAQNNLTLAKLNLKQAMLMPISQEVEIVVPNLDLGSGPDFNITAEEVFAAALDAMPQIKSAEVQVQSSQMGVRVAEAGYAPTLSISGSFRTNYSDAYKQPNYSAASVIVNKDANGNPILNDTYYQLPDGTPVKQISTSVNVPTETIKFGDQLDHNLFKSLTLNLNIPVFNNLQAKSNVQRAKISLQQSEIAVQEQKIALRQTIESAYNEARSASKTYHASLRQVEALEETFRSMENQYNLGAANFTDYQVANNNLFRAKSDLVRAKYDYIFKMKILDFYQGKPLSL